MRVRAVRARALAVLVPALCGTAVRTVREPGSRLVFLPFLPGRTHAQHRSQTQPQQVHTAQHRMSGLLPHVWVCFDRNYQTT